MRRLWLLVMLAVLASVLSVGGVMAAPGSNDPDAAKSLAQVRQATARYHDVATALADGYVPASPCVEVPGVGGMGIHYVNFGLAFGSPFSVDLSTPEILLYVPTKAGPRLVGVEYAMAAPLLTPSGEIIPWFDTEPPPAGFEFLPSLELFGRAMDGPMPPHEPGLEPWHYELHVWLWQGNPDGIFAPFNPSVKC